MKRLALSRALSLRLWGAYLSIAACLAGCVQLADKERELTFRPSRDAAYWFSGMPQGIRDVYLDVGAAPSVERIHAWWWPAERADAPVVLYLHGARWNLTGQLRRIEQLHKFGFAVFAIDYRGFGKSDGGLPSEESVYADALAAWNWLDEVQPDPSQRFIYGHSLGGAVAIDLAARLSANGIEAGGLIAESTFTNLADIAAAMSFDWLPTRWLLSQKFDSLDKIKRVRMPVLIAHGGSDRMVPARFSTALFEAASEPKHLLVVDGGSHNNTMIVGNDDYLQACSKLFGLATVQSGNIRILGAKLKPAT
jgi:alpha-beta hydrolase superfamily lysophospholipase